MKTIAAIAIVLAIFAVCVPVVAQENAPEPPVVVEPAPPEQGPPPPVVEPAPAEPGPPPAVVEPTAPPSVPDHPVAPPTAPSPPTPSGISRPTTPTLPPAQINRGSREVIVGPTDSKDKPKRVRGKVTVTAVPPASAAIASVEVFFNAAVIGQTREKPYKVVFNTDTVTPGIHTLKAIGLDANGKQVWTASTSVEVAGAAGAQPPTGAAATNAGSKPVGPRPPSGTTGGKVDASGAGLTVAKPGAPAPTGGVSLGKTYTSARNGFSVKYPAGWTAKDLSTAMKPRKPGNVWITFIPPASQKSALVANVRRMRLNPNTSADVFAKYNPYVNAWERKTVLGSQAFATVSGTPESKRVTHRLIIVSNGCAWMLNCIDTSGNSPDASGKLFESVVGSLTVNGPHPAKAVTVTEKGKKN